MDFSVNLIKWYKLNKRDLPWRNTSNPYYIWLSEIILQQTRVEQGLPYYLLFVKIFPTIHKLANAKEDEVLKLWQGLGYYSRARNLHFTAKFIVDNYNGKFPSDYKKLLKLKGVGSYTAAAVSSFAFALPYAVVDANVIRVLSRVFAIETPFDTAIGRKQFEKLAQKLLIKDNASVYNQSIMDFGALQCKPKSPDCYSCCMKDLCMAYQLNKIDSFPVRFRKIKVKNRYLHFLVIITDDGIYIRKRDSGIWKGLYEFPFFEFSRNISTNQVMRSKYWKRMFGDHNLEIKLIPTMFKHQLSHQRIYARFWEIRVNRFWLRNFIRVNKNEILEYPISRLMEKYLKTLNID